MRRRRAVWPRALGYRSLFFHRGNAIVKHLAIAEMTTGFSLTTVYHRQYGGAMQLALNLGRACRRRIAGSLAGNGVTGRLASRADG
jgi:hypothetical protein